MKQQDIDYAIIKNIINILSVMCAANSDMIIDKLIGVLWTTAEAEKIRESSGKFKYNLENKK